MHYFFYFTTFSIAMMNHKTIMNGQSLSSVTGLLRRGWTVRRDRNYSKTEIKKKQLTGEIDWELEAIRSAQNGWKDELCAIDYAAVPVV
jgi:hypothetical protein